MADADAADFLPIAVIGRACVLPGALSPGELWERVLAGEDLLSSVPPGAWRVPTASVLCSPEAPGEDRTWCERGGYVRGFGEQFDPSGFAVPAEELMALDPLVQWTVHCGRAALRSAGYAPDARLRAGAVLGNLSYPSSGLTRFAESIWLAPDGGAGGAVAGDRFMSGLPALLLARACRLSAGAFALDAACASGLYAVKLACDALREGRADLMLAGGVNRADDLFLHVGFCALGALSRSGRSRPFHRDADGLLPAEGAAFVLLKRLPDALADRDRILGVIRGIGLSNDGRGSGLLAPSEAGQVRALRAAYRQAGLTPRAISLLECHATGTPVGDRVELRSTGAVFAETGVDEPVPIGSLKSNLGHLITAAGLAGLLKVLGALEHRIRPPSRHAEAPLSELRDSPLRLLAAAEPWTSSGPRRAAVSAFGFGGNNAHLILEEWEPPRQGRSRPPAAPPAAAEAIAIVGIGALVGRCGSAPELARTLLGGAVLIDEEGGPDAAAATRELLLPLDGLRTPPSDLQQAQAQQLMFLRAVQEAVGDASRLAAARTGVLCGMGCDAEVARYTLRLRHPAQVQALDAVCSPLQAAGVLGAMPNLVANRLNSLLDLQGPSFTVSAEELSGMVALRLGLFALRAGELDACVVGAVDLCCEPVHRAAAAALLPSERQVPGDAAVALLLKRVADARRDQDTIYALIPPPAAELEPPALHLGLAEGALALTPQLGHAHAASGLLHVVAAALACHHRALPQGAHRPAIPWLADGAPRTAQVSCDSFYGASETLRLSEAADESGPRPGVALSATSGTPRLWIYSAPDRAALREAVAAQRLSADGPARLVIVADAACLAEQRAAALSFLSGDTEHSPPPLGEGPGFHFRARPLGGELAFVFTMAAAAYPGMGRELLLALPELVGAAPARLPGAQALAQRLYAGRGTDTPRERGELLDQLAEYSFLCQLHSALSQRLLGLRPQAAIGLCTGESSALFALGVWRDLDAMLAEIRAAGVYDRELAGEFAAVRRAWQRAGIAEVSWASWRILLPIDEVRAALAGEPRVYLTLIHSPVDCVLSGERSAGERVLARLGARGRRRARELSGVMAIHCPEVAEFAAGWRAIHHRQTSAVPGVRFYSHALGASYVPDQESAADALLGQAVATVDFPRLIERAWDDGVRVFLEHGPRGLCSGWIAQTLGTREHLALSLDSPGQPAVLHMLHGVAQLVAAGVPVQHQALQDQLPPSPPAPPQQGLRLRAHRPPVRRTAPEVAVVRTAPAALVPTKQTAVANPSVAPAEVQFMEPAPALLPPVAELQEQRPGPSAAPRAAAAAGRSESVASGAREGLSAAPRAADAAVAVAVAVIDRPPLRAFRQLALAALAQHRQFVEHQRVLQLQFLQTRSRALRALEGGGQPPRALALSSLAGHAPEAVDQLPSSGLVPTTDAPLGPPRAPAEPSGLKLTRAQLEVLASAQISSVFGPRFAAQDGYRRQVRMPMPPLLLADRVTGLVGEPGSMGTGTIWTETDVAWDAFYVHDGYMAAGAMVEAGQADLLLISWLGADFHNRGERVYRLLGCELSFHGGLPRPGDTLAYEITVEGHALQGGVRLFFFRYDCLVNGERRMTMRHGQAGFFTDAELAQSAGVLWDARDATPCPNPRLAPAVVLCQRTRFSEAQLTAFARGDAFACLGPGFELARTHVRTPRIADERLRFWQQVTELSVDGGPWGRGYLRAVQEVAPTDWYFAGHFKDDPCMPGTLMCEACLQAMGLFLAALGYTLTRDGWRFEPVSDEVFVLRCRGQVTPRSQQVVYEVFVEEIVDGPQPTLYADVLCTVDGLKAFHGRRLGYRLVPDWPLSSQRTLPAAGASERPAVFDYPALLACAWGRPSAAFGEPFRRYDALQRIPRLPGPPYHFMSRVTALRAECGVLQTGGEVEVEYDVPADAWYFAAGDRPAMPLAVLLEVALQPCGWLAMYVGCRLFDAAQLFFRNLDGSATLSEPVYADAGRLTTRARLTQLSRSAGIILVGFEVQCQLHDRTIYAVKTVFGFFPPESLAAQVGLPVSEPQRAELHAPSDYVRDLHTLPGDALGGPLGATDPPLLMLDRVTGYWPTGGKAGLGRLRAEKDIDAGQWFFKAHFYQDPVQPGSLGLQAMLQLLQYALLAHGVNDAPAELQWEPIALGVSHSWRYRGQVTPRSRRLVVVVELTEWQPADLAPYARAEAWLWVDELCIYHARDLAVRAVRRVATEPPDSSPPAPLSIAAAQQFWLARLGVPLWPGAELLGALAQRFVGRIHCEAPDELARLRATGALILANHQVQVESLLFPLLLAGALGRPVVTLANALHRAGWLGQLVRQIFSYPQVPDPDIIRYFDQGDPGSLLGIVDGFRPELRSGTRAVMVHVEGKLGLCCRQPVQVLSGLFVDLALAAGVPILPVRFAGALPVTPLERSRDFPLGYGRQDYYLGRPLWPEELRALPYGERKRRVLAALNQLGPPLDQEMPAAADPDFAAAVAQWQQQSGSAEAQAVILQALLRAPALVTDCAQRLAEGVRRGRLRLPAGAVGVWLAQLASWLYGPASPVRTAPELDDLA